MARWCEILSSCQNKKSIHYLFTVFSEIPEIKGLNATKDVKKDQKSEFLEGNGASGTTEITFFGLDTMNPVCPTPTNGMSIPFLVV